MDSDLLTQHPDGFDFGYRLWYACECGQRVQRPTGVSGSTDTEPLFCGCGSTIEWTDECLTLRDPNDIDCQDDQVDRHFWYHSSTYPDWPSPSYHDDLVASVQRSLLPEFDHAEQLAARTSLALHLGTYAAAIENMVRRRVSHEDTPASECWLHQVEVQLEPQDLAPGVHDELADWLGNVPLRTLTDRGARAVRYLNRRESPGSISLAIDPRVILRIRTIQLPVRAAAVPSVDRGERAVAAAIAALRDAEQLKPDTSGVPRNQVFDSELSLTLAAFRGAVASDEARRIARQMETYTERKNEIRLDLRTTLADIYLTSVNQRLRDELIEFIALESELERYHQQIRALAGLIARSEVVVQQLAAAPWRTVRADEPPP